MLEAVPNNRFSTLNSFNGTEPGSQRSLFSGDDSRLIPLSQHSTAASLNSDLSLVQLPEVRKFQRLDYTDHPLKLSELLPLSGDKHRQSFSLGSETVSDMEAHRFDQLLNGGESRKKRNSGNTLGTAQRIKLTNQWQTIADSVGSSDRSDFYRFNLDTSKSFRLRLAGEQNNVDMTLLNASGQVVEDLSGPFRKNRVALNTGLDAGTYYLKVTGHDGDSPYQLSLSTDPGSARRAAQPLSRNQKTLVGTVGSTDQSDMYRFIVDKKSTVQCNLKGLKANADLALMDDQGQVIQTSRRFGKKQESITEILEQGVYYVKVTGWGEETKYRLNMSVQEEPVPLIPKPSVPGTGIFTVGETGEVSVDYLFDGSASQGELAIFNLAGMEQYGIGSTRYMQEAMLRALGNSADSGYVAILDQTEGARFNSSPEEPNFNAGEYRGTKTFTMNPGDKFGIILLPNGTTPDTLFKTDLSGDQRPLFSMPEANPESAIQFAQIVDVVADGNSFAFEDTSLTTESDRDFDDLVFQMKGAMGNSPLLNSVVVPEKDWRTSEVGQQVEQFTVDPLDLAGNTIDAARRVNTATAGKSYQGWVGTADKDDFYSFSLGAKNDFRLSLDGLKADVNVELLDMTGKVITSSKNPGIASEAISTTLDTGAYRVRVTSATDIGTAFNLKLAVTPIIKGVEGITTTGSEARIGLDLNDSRRLINVDNFRSGNTLQNSRPEFAGINGRGYSIAVLDTGIDSGHAFFGADRIVYQQDFTFDDMIADDTHGHGTHVASIALSSDPGLTGIASGSNIISLKVIGNQDGGKEFFADVEQALQWVIANAEIYNIASVNMSFSDRTVDLNGDGNKESNGNYQTLESIQNAQQEFGIADELAALKTKNVIVVDTAGNHFLNYGGSAQGEGYPGADPNTLSVGSVLDGGIDSNPADRISQTSQRGSNLTDIFAPGEVITAARAGGGTADMSGTSMAAPHIAGMAALAQQLAQQELNRQLTPDEFRQLLYNSGVPISDPVTGVTTFRRADMLGLANAIMDLRPPSDRNIDLSASRFDVVQPALNTGDALTANFQIQNTGLDSTSSFNVNFYLSDDNFITQRDYLLGSFTVDRLSSNGNTGLLSQSLNLPSPSNPIWRSFGSGSGYVGMIVDGLNTVGETNENNNSNLGLALDSDAIALSQQGQLTTTINRLVGDFDGLGAGASDYFTLVSFSDNPPNDENAWLRSPEQTGNDISPNWQLGQPVTGVTVPITIRVYDNDGLLTFGNDYVDVDPNGGDKDLNLTYNLFTGEVSGDVVGTQGQQLYSRGSGDDNQGEIWFTVNFDLTA